MGEMNSIRKKVVSKHTFTIRSFHKDRCVVAMQDFRVAKRNG
jgi:hypothetical protein